MTVITYCEGCGEALENNPSIAGVLRKRRKWCSDSCRKRTLYYSECIDCGKRVSYASGRDSNRSHRCAGCAADVQTIWTADAITLAIQDFAEEYGRPPVATDWNPAHARNVNTSAVEGVGERWPSATTVQAVFGSWNAGIEAAGFTPLRSGAGRRAAA